MKIALSCAVVFSIVTGAGTYAYLTSSPLGSARTTAAATASGENVAHGERDGSISTKPISRRASR